MKKCTSPPQPYAVFKTTEKSIMQHEGLVISATNSEPISHASVKLQLTIHLTTLNHARKSSQIGKFDLAVDLHGNLFH